MLWRSSISSSSAARITAAVAAMSLVNLAEFCQVFNRHDVPAQAHAAQNDHLLLNWLAQ
jgi:hypothetical protein